MSHFSAVTIRRLAKRGIRVIGLQYLPDMSSDMPYANGDTGYRVADNGCHRVWTFRQVLEAAK
jgi:hypothetical protein